MADEPIAIKPTTTAVAGHSATATDQAMAEKAIDEAGAALLRDVEMRVPPEMRSAISEILAREISHAKLSVAGVNGPQALALAQEAIRHVTTLIQQRTEEARIQGAVRDATYQVIADQMVELSAAAEERVRIRSQMLTEHTMHRFAESMVDQDLPPELRKEATRDLEKLLRSPDMQDEVKLYNSTSQEARTQVNAQYEQANDQARKMAKDPKFAGASRQLEDAAILGTTVEPDTQADIKDMKSGRVPVAQGAARIDHGNDRKREQVAANVELVLPMLPDATRRELEKVGGPDEIVARAMQLHHQRDYKHLTATDQAVLRAFALAKEKTLFTRMGEIARDIDLERNKSHSMGYEYELEERTQKVFEKIRGSDEFQGIPEKKLREEIKSSFREADTLGIDIKTLRAMNDEQFYTMGNSVFESSIGQKSRTAVDHMASGAFAMISGNQELAEWEAKTVGMGVRRTLKSMGVNEDAAQAIGHVAGGTLRVAGVAASGTVKNIAITAGAFGEISADLLHGNLEAAKQHYMDGARQLKENNDKAAVGVLAAAVGREKAEHLVHHGVEDTKKQVAHVVDDQVKKAAAIMGNAANALQIALHANEDIQKQLAGMNSAGWKKFTVDDGHGHQKALFDRNGDGKLDVGEIRKALNAAHVKLDQFDANHDGHMDGKELTNAMNAAVKQQHAKLSR